MAESLDYRAAANTARQFVRQALELQNLHEVLDAIAGDQSSINELRGQLVVLQGQIAAQKGRLEEANREAETAERSAKEKHHSALTLREQQIARLGDVVARLEQRERELQASVGTLEQSERDIRARLSAALGPQ